MVKVVFHIIVSCALVCMFLHLASVKCSGLIKDFNTETYIKPLDGGNVETTLGSNVTLKWSCHVGGNHSIDMLAWSLKLHTVTNRARIALIFYSPVTFWIDLTKSMLYRRRVTWTGVVNQGKVSFVIQDVRISDAQWYQLSWKVLLPIGNGSSEVVVRRHSNLLVTLTERSTYKPSLTQADTQSESKGMSVMLSTSTRTTSTQLDVDKTDVAHFSIEAKTVSPKRSDDGDLPRSKKTDHFATLMIFAISSAIAIAVLSVIIVGLCRKIKKRGYEKNRGVNQRRTEVEMTHAPRLERMQVEVEDTRAEQDEQVDTCPPTLLPRAPRSIQWEFPKARLQIREVFGQGAFGQVAKGLAFQIAGKASWTVVAVKMLKGWRVHSASISWEILCTYCLTGRDRSRILTVTGQPKQVKLRYCEFLDRLPYRLHEDITK